MVSIMEHRTILIIIGESSKIVYTNQTFYMAVFADIRGLWLIKAQIQTRHFSEGTKELRIEFRNHMIAMTDD